MVLILSIASLEIEPEAKPKDEEITNCLLIFGLSD